MSIFKYFCRALWVILALSHDIHAQYIQISKNFYWEDEEKKVYRKRSSGEYIVYVVPNGWDRIFGKSRDYYQEYKALFSDHLLEKCHGKVVFIDKRDSTFEARAPIHTSVESPACPSTPGNEMLPARASLEEINLIKIPSQNQESAASTLNSNAVITLNSNLDVYPSNFHHASPGDCVTIGDMHGNTMKFIYFLIQEGILKLRDPKVGNSGMSQEQLYDELNNIYKSHKFSNDVNMDRFEEIINAVDINTDVKFRLMGGLLADRGENDTFTLHLLNKLHKSQAKFEILLSNHDLEFIRFYENLKKDSNYRLPVGIDKHFQSLSRLSARLSKNSKESKKRVDFVLKTFEESYLPHLKLLSYDIDSVSGLTYTYSHAPIRFNMIATVLREIDPDRRTQFDHDKNTIGINAENVTQFIDAINEKFNIWKKNGEIGKNYEDIESSTNMKALKFNKEFPTLHRNFYYAAPALYQLLYSRIEDYVYGTTPSVEAELKRRNSYCPSGVITVAGHDLGKLTKTERGIILDNQLGKKDVGSGIYNNIESYDILHTHPRNWSQ